MSNPAFTPKGMANDLANRYASIVAKKQKQQQQPAPAPARVEIVPAVEQITPARWMSRLIARNLPGMRSKS